MCMPVSLELSLEWRYQWGFDSCFSSCFWSFAVPFVLCEGFCVFFLWANTKPWFDDLVAEPEGLEPSSSWLQNMPCKLPIPITPGNILRGESNAEIFPLHCFCLQTGSQSKGEGSFGKFLSCEWVTILPPLAPLLSITFVDQTFSWCFQEPLEVT